MHAATTAWRTRTFFWNVPPPPERCLWIVPALPFQLLCRGKEGLKEERKDLPNLFQYMSFNILTYSIICHAFKKWASSILLYKISVHRIIKRRLFLHEN